MYYRSKCPYSRKYELVDWASDYFNEPKSKFNRMPKKQLFAIFYSIDRRLKK